MNHKTYGLQIGRFFIADLLNPLPEQIDTLAIRERLVAMKRWSNDPHALTVFEHTMLVMLLAGGLRDHPEEMHEAVIFWCEHHDDHEAITGDIPGPLKALIGQETAILEAVETGLDQAICAANGWTPPSAELRAVVHAYDKMSETIEWLYVFGNDPAPWNYPLHEDLTPELCQQLLWMARCP